MITMAEVPPGAEEKNRYKDVLPSEQNKTQHTNCSLGQYLTKYMSLDPYSRVALFLKFGVPNSDYINANYIRVGNQ